MGTLRYLYITTVTDKQKEDYLNYTNLFTFLLQKLYLFTLCIGDIEVFVYNDGNRWIKRGLFELHRSVYVFIVKVVFVYIVCVCHFLTPNSFSVIKCFGCCLFLNKRNMYSSYLCLWNLITGIVLLRLALIFGHPCSKKFDWPQSQRREGKE